VSALNLSAMVKAVDDAGSWLYLKLLRERSALLVFMYHGLFADQPEIERKLADPQQAITVDHFRRFIEYYRQHGYQFVSPDEVIRGLPAGGHYAMITFDDGYFNNHRALPVLDEFDVPAVFFVSANHVRDGKAYWWDVLYRERSRRRASLDAIHAEVAAVMAKAPAEIDDYLTAEFGSASLKPVSDIDRPFNPSELKDFSKNRHVVLGNHASNHALLSRGSAATITAEVEGGQHYLQEITGKVPNAIAYPNGDYSEEAIKICRSLGLQLGITCDHRKNYLPIENAMTLGRFCLYGRDDLLRQCELRRSDLLLHYRAREWKQRLTSKKG
jgi:peptidoglycan/xylan/chitin deacetylase (PgdA/CDA1 family)